MLIISCSCVFRQPHDFFLYNVVVSLLYIVRIEVKVLSIEGWFVIYRCLETHCASYYYILDGHLMFSSFIMNWISSLIKFKYSSHVDIPVKSYCLFQWSFLKPFPPSIPCICSPSVVIMVNLQPSLFPTAQTQLEECCLCTFQDFYQVIFQYAIMFFRREVHFQSVLSLIHRNADLQAHYIHAYHPTVSTN